MKKWKNKRGFVTGTVKTALDNLSSGICFFDQNGILILCNRRMYEIVFEMTGRDPQNQYEMEEILAYPFTEGGIRKEGDLFLFPQGTVWKFHREELTDSEGNVYTEFTAFDVTQLHMRQEELRKKNREQRQIMERLRNISDNAVSILRNEEILSMRMQIHNELGVALGVTRQFLLSGCPAQEKKAYCMQQKKMAKALLGEVGNSAEVDPFTELKKTAERLDMRIRLEGNVPEDERLRNLLTCVVRECLTNAVRHAGGDEVWVQMKTEDDFFYARITNNGAAPENEIVPGGGLLSVRKRMEQSGGVMEIQSLPKFALTVRLPMAADGERRYGV